MGASSFYCENLTRKVTSQEEGTAIPRTAEPSPTLSFCTLFKMQSLQENKCSRMGLGWVAAKRAYNQPPAPPRSQPPCDPFLRLHSLDRKTEIYSYIMASWVTGRRAWQPTLAFLPGESPGQRSLAVHSPWSHKELDKTERLILLLSPAGCIFCMIFVIIVFTLKEYMQLSKKYYSTEPQAVDFLECAEDTRKKINSWVKTQTKGKTKEIISALLST